MITLLCLSSNISYLSISRACRKDAAVLIKTRFQLFVLSFCRFSSACILITTEYDDVQNSTSVKCCAPAFQSDKTSKLE